MKSTTAPPSPQDRPLETLDEATAYLDGLINRERDLRYSYVRLDLAPIRALLDGIGRPHEALSAIHVAGSKGKGSTCLFAEAILLELGERVGTFTSPHLESWRERFRIDGQPIDAERLVAAVERVRPTVEALRGGPKETQPSFFDATTAVAFLLFAESGVDRAIIEVGLGGRLDSTNVLSPAVTCITSIELEHTDKLGDTEALIAGEKAGILKLGVPVVLGLLRQDAAAVATQRARSLGAPISRLGEDFDLVLDPSAASPDSASASAGLPPSSSRSTGPPDLYTFYAGGRAQFETRLAVPGDAARSNAALAIECVRQLGTHADATLALAAGRALASCRLPARTEVLASDPAVIVDAAHTKESARALAAALVDLAPDGFDLLLSVSGDKNLEALLEALLPRARRVTVTCAEPIRSLPADALGKRVEAFALAASLEIELTVEADPETAAREARVALGERERLCATGSVYLAGVARRVLGASEKPCAQGSVDTRYSIGLAKLSELASLPEIERRAAQIFSAEELSPEIAAAVRPLVDLEPAQADARLIVARRVDSSGANRAETGAATMDGEVVGFALLETLDGQPHLEEIDVDPEHARRGVGRRLVEAACGWAFESGGSSITLSTFRDVAWNAPFYAKLGFGVVAESDYSEAMRALRAAERARGLATERRVIMRRTITRADRPSGAPFRKRDAPR